MLLIQATHSNRSYGFKNTVICKGEPEDRKPGRGDENEESNYEADDRQLQTGYTVLAIPLKNSASCKSLLP